MNPRIAVRHGIFTLGAAALLTAAGGMPGPDGAAVRAGGPRAEPLTLEQADSLYWGGEPGRALDAIDAVLAQRPDDYDAAWRGARAAISAGLLVKEQDEQRALFRRGIAHGRAAVRLRPDGVDGLFWLTANEGRLSFLLPPRGAARAAQTVLTLAERVLALDSLHAGAHDVLGKLNARVMEFNAVQRVLARTLFGNDAIKSASWQRAERHLLRAVELDPTWMAPHADLGETYLYQGRFELAERELSRALELPIRHPGERDFRERATWQLWFAQHRRRP